MNDEIENGFFIVVFLATTLFLTRIGRKTVQLLATLGRELNVYLLLVTPHDFSQQYIYNVIINLGEGKQQHLNRIIQKKDAKQVTLFLVGQA